ESYQRRVVNNIVGSRWHFAHSSLIYSVKDKSVFDPFGLTESQPNEATLRFVRKIREPHAAFIAVLQGMMESSVYGIPTSVEFEQMSSQILDQSAAGM